jgi:hypothetical protein
MKILVDEMPERNAECPYCKNIDYEYICSWNNSSHECQDVDDCPYFISKSENNSKKS